MARSLIVLPNDSAKPIIDAIGAARRSLRIKMFVFSDRTLLNAVVAAGRRGVKVQVMLNPARRSGERDNEHTRKLLERARVRVRDANPAFDLTHEKSMVVDDAAAFVKSFTTSATSSTGSTPTGIVRRSRRVRRRISCGALDPAEIASASSSTTPGTDSSSRTSGFRMRS